MQIRLCNRCQAPVPAQPALGSVTLPPEDPALRPKAVTDPFTVALSLGIADPGVDLCPVCLVSAFVEYALIVMTGVLTPQVARQLQARINTALGFAVGGAA